MSIIPLIRQSLLSAHCRKNVALLTYHSKSYRAIKFYLYCRNKQPEPTFALDPANARHYKCGARLIADVLRLKANFDGNLILVKRWYEMTLAIGI